MEQKGYLVEGYVFYSQKEAKRAAAELKKIQSLDEKLDVDQISSVKTLYCRAVDQKVFETEIGMTYLRNLQSHLIANGALTTDQKPLPVEYSKYQQESALASLKEEYEVVIQEKSNRYHKSLEEQHQIIKELKQRARYYLIACGILVVALIAMFIIANTGNHPNVINYKHNLENTYAEWEEQLNDREKLIRQKEAELQITNEAQSDGTNKLLDTNAIDEDEDSNTDLMIEDED